MLAAPMTQPVPTNSHRRNAFTLLEVLVVVAILVALASVASIAVFRYLDDARVDKAMLDMQALDRAYHTYCLKNDIDPGTQQVDVSQLAQYLEQGSKALRDPWNGTYQMEIISDENGPRAQFFTMNTKTNQRVSWPNK